MLKIPDRFAVQGFFLPLRCCLPPQSL